MDKDKTAGERWIEFSEVLQEVIDGDHKVFNNWEIDFAKRVLGVLSLYKENTFLSAKQINVIHKLDGKMHG